MESGMKVGRKKVAKKAARTKKPAKTAAPKRRAAAQGAGKRAAGQSALGNGGPITWNIKLIAHHLLHGFGGIGEGMSIQTPPDGRRILWPPHENAPEHFHHLDGCGPAKAKGAATT